MCTLCILTAFLELLSLEPILLVLSLARQKLAKKLYSTNVFDDLFSECSYLSQDPLFYYVSLLLNGLTVSNPLVSYDILLLNGLLINGPTVSHPSVSYDVLSSLT
jgi:hypothetical protein